MTSLEDLWRSVVSEVSRGVAVSPRILAVVESAVPQGIMGETLYLEVDSDFARDMIDQRARDEILAALTAVSADFETVNNFALVVNPSMRELDDEVFDNPVAVTPRDRTPETAPASNTRLNPKYTFDNFVIGTSNRFAHAAALADADLPPDDHLGRLYAERISALRAGAPKDWTPVTRAMIK
jgi:chromosomal replication initiator protein